MTQPKTKTRDLASFHRRPRKQRQPTSQPANQPTNQFRPQPLHGMPPSPLRGHEYRRDHPYRAHSSETPNTHPHVLRQRRVRRTVRLPQWSSIDVRPYANPSGIFSPKKGSRLLQSKHRTQEALSLHATPYLKGELLSQHRRFNRVAGGGGVSDVSLSFDETAGGLESSSNVLMEASTALNALSRYQLAIYTNELIADFIFQVVETINQETGSSFDSRSFFYTLKKETMQYKRMYRLKPILRDSFSSTEIAQYKTSAAKFPLHIALYAALDSIGFPIDKWPGVHGPNAARNRYAYPMIGGVDPGQLVTHYIDAFEPDNIEADALNEVVSWVNRIETQTSEPIALDSCVFKRTGSDLD